LSKTLADFKAVPNITTAAGEWQIYMDVVANQELPDDVTTFWHATEDRLPTLAALAKAYIALPVSSVDVECSFSKYGSVLSPVRQSLSNDSLRAYCSVFYS